MGIYIDSMFSWSFVKTFLLFGYATAYGRSFWGVRFLRSYSTLRSCHILSIDHTYDSCDWDCEDDTEDTTEWRTCEHHDEYEKRGEVECLAHDVWDEDVVLDTLDDEIEGREDEGRLPWDAESDDHGRDEGDEWSDIRDELHDTADDREGERLLSVESEYPLHEHQTDIRSGEYTHREDEGSLDPGSRDVLDRAVVSCQVVIEARRRYVDEESSDTPPLEYHEECRDRDESPVRDDASDCTDDWDTPTREGSYLCGDDGLDIACVLLDDVESVFDILLAEYEEDDPLNIWVKMESSDPISEIYWLSTVDPIDDEGCSLSDVVHHDRDERAYHDTPEEEHDDIDADECEPWWYPVLLSEVDEGIHDDREESCYEHECDDGREHPEDVESCGYREEYEDLFDPELEFGCHIWSISYEWLYADKR